MSAAVSSVRARSSCCCCAVKPMAYGIVGSQITQIRVALDLGKLFKGFFFFFFKAGSVKRRALSKTSCCRVSKLPLTHCTLTCRVSILKVCLKSEDILFPLSNLVQIRESR